MNTFIVLALVVAVAVAVTPAGYHGTTKLAKLHFGAKVISASSYDDEQFTGCQDPSTAIGTPDWSAQTSCGINEQVSSCSYANMLWTASIGEIPACDIFYLCEGWSADLHDENPQITIGLGYGVTAIDSLAIHEKGSLGWVHQVDLVASDGYTETVYTSPTAKNVPSEAYKGSPSYTGFGSFFAPGLDYRGGVNVTTIGVTCENWGINSRIPEGRGYGVRNNHNFCRNPDNDELGPWCWIKDGFGGVYKEYCTIPQPPEICNDDPLTISIATPSAKVFNAVTIKMKKLYGTIAAIDAIAVNGERADGCFQDETKGFWNEPHCDVCKAPYKGSDCTSQTCDSGAVCWYGDCTQSGCECKPGFYGAACDNICPSSKDDAAVIASPSSLMPQDICYGHGTCSDGASGSGACTCDHGYATSDCSKLCPGFDVHTGSVCSQNNGTCSMGSSGTGTCTCFGTRYGTDCSKTLCGVSQCYNGDCINGACTCWRNDDQGHWTGSKCDSCASRYQGDTCAERIRETKTLTGTLSDMPESYLGSILAVRRSKVEFHVSGTGEFDFQFGNMLEGGGKSSECRGSITSGNPSASCTVNRYTFRNSVWDNQDQKVQMVLRPRQTGSTYTVTFKYEPNCRNECGDHGFCKASSDEAVRINGGNQQPNGDQFLFDGTGMPFDHSLKTMAKTVQTEGKSEAFHVSKRGMKVQFMENLQATYIDDIGKNHVEIAVEFGGNGGSTKICYAPAGTNAGSVSNIASCTGAWSAWPTGGAETITNANDVVFIITGLTEGTAYSYIVVGTDVGSNDFAITSLSGQPNFQFLTLSGPSTYSNFHFTLHDSASADIMFDRQTGDSTGRFLWCLTPVAYDPFPTDSLDFDKCLRDGDDPSLTNLELNFKALNATTSYNVYYATATGDFSDVSGVSGPFTFTTNSMPGVSTMDVFWPDTTSIGFNFLVTAPGQFHGVLRSSPNSPLGPYAIQSAAVGTNGVVGSYTAMSLPQASYYQIVFTGLTASTTYLFEYVLEDTVGTLGYSQPQLSITTGGTAPTILNALRHTGTFGRTARLVIDVDLAGVLVVAQRFQSDPVFTENEIKDSTNPATRVFTLKAPAGSTSTPAPAITPPPPTPSPGFPPPPTPSPGFPPPPTPTPGFPPPPTPTPGFPPPPTPTPGFPPPPTPTPGFPPPPTPTPGFPPPPTPTPGFPPPPTPTPGFPPPPTPTPGFPPPPTPTPGFPPPPTPSPGFPPPPTPSPGFPPPPTPSPGFPPPPTPSPGFPPPPTPSPGFPPPPTPSPGFPPPPTPSPGFPPPPTPSPGFPPPPTPSPGFPPPPTPTPGFPSAMRRKLLQSTPSPTGSAQTTIEIQNLVPGTKYALDYLVADGPRTVWSSGVNTVEFEMGLVGVTGCNRPLPFDGYCTPNAVEFFDMMGAVCKCTSGFTCLENNNPPSCLDEEAFLKQGAIYGSCQCDLSATAGYWNGTRCDACYPGFFPAGSCDLSCKRGSLASGASACTCPSATHFTGKTCNTCESVGGYYGENCDTASPMVTNVFDDSIGVGSKVQYGAYRAMTYSKVTIEVQVNDVLQDLSSFSEVKLIRYKNYTDIFELPAPTDTCGNGFNSFGSMDGFGMDSFGFDDTMGGGFDNFDNFDMGMGMGMDMGMGGGFGGLIDAATTVAASNEYSLRCDQETSWDKSTRVGVCSLVVEEGFNFFSIELVSGDRQVPYSLTVRAVSGCCNGHGFCGNYTDECTCVETPTIGYYNSLTQCATCRVGFGGLTCQDVSGVPDKVTTGVQAMVAGESQWYSLEVANAMKFKASIDGDADCDLYVSLTQQCGEGWELYNGNCYKIFVSTANNECTTFDNASAMCNREGGDLASIDGLDHWDFIKRMWYNLGLGEDRNVAKHCSTRVQFGLRRFIAPCTLDSAHRPKSQTECEKYSEFCKWMGSACDPKDTPNMLCGNAIDENDCNGMSYCQWTNTIDDPFSGPEVPGCMPSWIWTDGSHKTTWAKTIQKNTEMMKNPVFSSDAWADACRDRLNETYCFANPTCRWDPNFAACETSFPAPRIVVHGGGGPDLASYEKEPYCAAIAMVPDTEDENGQSDITIVPHWCNLNDRNLNHVNPGNPSNPSAGYMCSKPAAALKSHVTPHDVKIFPTTPQKRLLGVPQCSLNSAKYTANCEQMAPRDANIAVLRVTCLNNANVELKAEYVKRSRFHGHSVGVDECKNNHEFGSWGGDLCAECAPRYRGRDCKQFVPCDPNPDTDGNYECGSHGTCNTNPAAGNNTFGYCECQPNYFGLKCDKFCGAGTCNGNGTCNTRYQRCNEEVEYGSPRQCKFDKPICHCHGNFDGEFCNTCKSGFWGQNSCAKPCACNGHECDAVTGACTCSHDDIRGYWNETTACSTCVEGYYGVQCLTACDATTTCNGNGTCARDGSCTCNTNYYGFSCNKKCTASLCSDHGTCNSATGACECTANFVDGFWGGSSCATCAFGYWGDKCDKTCSCNAKGSCNKDTGVCSCYRSTSLGFWAGSECRSCFEGYMGDSCTIPAEAATSELSTFPGTYVSESDRVTKSTSMRGALVNFYIGTTEYFYAASGMQISLMSRASDATTFDFVGTCNINTIISYGDDFIGGFKFGDTAFFIFTDTSRTYLIPMSITDPPINSDGTCSFVVESAVNLYDPTTPLSNASFAHTAIDVVFDAPRSSAYVLYKRFNETLELTDPLGAPVYKISKLYVEGSQYTAGFDHEWQSATEDLTDFSVVTSMALIPDADAPAVIVGGLNRGLQVTMSKIFLPTLTTDLANGELRLRSVLTFPPGVCSRVACSSILKMAYHRNLLYSSIATTGGGVVGVRMNIAGDNLKKFDENYAYVTLSTTAAGAGFIAYDSFADRIYMSAGNSTPSVIYKLNATSMEKDVASRTLSYEHVSTEYQVAIDAFVNVAQRLMYVLTRQTRTQVLPINLYDVEKISPVVVDGGGGTIVNITGRGFSVLSTDYYILCKFGGVENRQSNATYISDKMIQCKAPLVKGFDACKDVPLEVSFSNTQRYTANNILVRHVNMPSVESISPSDRGSLVHGTTLTVVGSGFVASEYLSCLIDGSRMPGTFIASREIQCKQPPRAAPARTTLEVSLDGQKFSNNKVKYFIVGEPVTMRGEWNGVSSIDTYRVVAKERVNLKKLTVVFYDSANTDVGDRDEPIRNYTVTVSIKTAVTAPRGAQFGLLKGKTTQGINRGRAVFEDLYLEYPGSGTYTLALTFNHPNSTVKVGNATFVMDVVASRLAFVTPPAPFSTNKEKFTVQPQIKFADVADNVAVNEEDKVTLEVVPVNNASMATLVVEGGSGPSVTYADGLVKYSNLRLRSAVEGEYYRLRWSAGKQNIAPLMSEPIHIPFCAAQDNIISGLIPSAQPLTAGATNVTVKGWNYKKENEQYTLCKYGDFAPTRATFIDTCTILCGLPAMTKPFAAALEVAVNDPPTFSAMQKNFTYVNQTSELTWEVQGNQLKYPSAREVVLNDVTVRFRDNFGNWMREFDIGDRTVYFKTNMPITKASNVTSKVVQRATATWTKLTTVLPRVGRYAFWFSTNAALDIPTYSGSGSFVTFTIPENNSTEPNLDVSQTIGTIDGKAPKCPRPEICKKMGRFMQCTYRMDESEYTLTVPEFTPAPNATGVPPTAAPTTSAPTPSPNATSAPTPVPGALVTPAPPTLPGNASDPRLYITFSTLLVLEIVQGIPHQLLFDGKFSLFTTNRRKLDMQPVVRVADEAGNTVTFNSNPTVTATISPTPLCLSPQQAGQTVQEWEALCTRVEGTEITVSNGLATFTKLQFMGVVGQKFIISFAVTLPGIRSLDSPPIYVADCPSSNAPVSRIVPDWVSTKTGGVITVKGWDFQPTQNLKLRLGNTKYAMTYVDTCTSLCVIPASGSSQRRGFDAQQSGPAQGLKISVADENNAGFQSDPIGFQMKGEIATQVGFSKSERKEESAERQLGGYTGKQTLTTEAVPCVSTPADAATDCYRAAEVINIEPIFIALQDVAGGDLYLGHGWVDGLNSDALVKITLFSKPAAETRLTAEEIFEGPTSGWTEKGLLSLWNMKMRLPKTGEYVFKFETTTPTKNGGSYGSNTYSIKVYQGPPVKLVVRETQVLQNDPKLGIPLIRRAGGEDLAISIEMHDVADNAVGVDQLSDVSRLEMTAELIPTALIQPSPRRDIILDQKTVVASNYGGVTQNSAATISPFLVALGSTDFAFTTSKVQGPWFGVRYNITFSINNDLYAARLGKLQVALIHANCPNFNAEYGKNFTGECRALPVGGTMGNTSNSLFLSATPNYWRYQFQDDKFYECPGDANCLGGYWSTCTTGTTGPTCAVCEPNWGKQEDTCVECPPTSVTVLTLLGLGIAMLIIILIMVRSNLSLDGKSKSVFSIVIKILMNHLQTAALMQEFMAKIKGMMKDMAGAQQKSSPDTNVASFACATGWNMYNIFLMWMIVPALVLAIPGIICFGMAYGAQKAKNQRRKALREEIVRREQLGLDAADQEIHLQVVRTGAMPTTLQDGFDSDSEGIRTPSVASEVDPEEGMQWRDQDLEDVLQHERTEFESAKLRRMEARRKKVEKKVRELAAIEATKAVSTMRNPKATPEERDAAQKKLLGLSVVGTEAWSAPTAESRALPDNWEEFVSRSTGYPYWRNTETKETTWLRPSVVDPKNLAPIIDGSGPAAASAVDPDGEPVVPHPNAKPAVEHTGPKPCLTYCSVCLVDFALYECSECGTEKLMIPYCENCWNVMHAPGGDTGKHIRRFYATEEEQFPELGDRYRELYEQLVEVRTTIPPKEVYIVTVMVVIFLIYPRLMTQIATMMKCTRIDSLDRSFLEADMTIECDTPQYNRWKFIATLFFFAYGLGIPVMGTLLLYKKRNHLMERKVIGTYGFLYSGYRLNRFYWEFVIMIRKMLVVFIIVFYSGDKVYQTMFGMWLITLFLFLNIFAQPFQLKLYWTLENVSLASVSATLNLAILYQDHFGLDSTAEGAVTICIFIINLIVFIVFGYYIFYAAKVQFYMIFDKENSGKVTWKEMVLVVKREVYQNFGHKLKGWGVDMKDPDVVARKQRELEAKRLAEIAAAQEEEPIPEQVPEEDQQ